MGVEIEGRPPGGWEPTCSQTGDTILDEFGKEEVISQLNMKSDFYDNELLYGEPAEETD